MSGKLPLAQIHLDEGIQPRAELSKEVIGDYTLAMTEGAVFPPVTVFFDSETYWLADGFHRCRGAMAAGLEEIAAEIREGGRREAILHAVGANATHGLRRTNEDKRRAVRMLLDDPEWAGWSDREIASRCAVDGKTVAALRPKLSAEVPQIGQPRKATRGGTTFAMKPRTLLPVRQPREPTIDKQHEQLMTQMLHLLRNTSDVSKEIDPETLFRKTPEDLRHNFDYTLQAAAQFMVCLHVEHLRVVGNKAELQRAAQFLSDLAKRLEADQGAAEIHAVSEGRP